MLNTEKKVKKKITYLSSACSGSQLDSSFIFYPLIFARALESSFYCPSLYLMAQKLREVQYYTQSHTVNLWQKEYWSQIYLSFLPHSLSKPCCPFASPFVALEDCVPRGEVCLEVRKPDRCGRLPELPLLGCTSVFVFLGPQLDKGCHWKLCCCSQYQGVMVGNCDSWGAEASSGWFAHIGICVYRETCHRPEIWGVLWAPSSTLAFSDSGEVRMSAGKKNLPQWIPGSVYVTQLVSLAFLSVVYFPRHFGQRGSL